MTIDRHIYFPSEDYDRILDYSIKNNYKISTAVCRLVKIALDNIDVMDRLDKLQNDVTYSIKEQHIIFSLLKQLYSDLEFENITDPNTSKSVIEFMKKIRGNKIND